MTNLISFLHTTAAYQATALQLMVGEANFAARQLGLPETVPVATNLLRVAEVQPPPTGVSGAVGTTNYTFFFQKGRLRSIRKVDWLKKVQPPVSNFVELALQASLLDSNDACQLATQWLAGLSVDVVALEQKHARHPLQITARALASEGVAGSKRLTPLFLISWGERAPPFDLQHAARVKLLGSTRELLELDIHDQTLLRRPPLVITNQADLLGPLPPPRYFVEQLVGGPEAYKTVASPDRVEMFLLNSRVREEEFQLPEIRHGPTLVNQSTARSLSRVLLDFKTYQWGAAKLCSPDYGVKVRFVKRDAVVEVLFCFECDILAVMANGKTRVENFDFNHNGLVEVVQKIFPRDERIRKLEKNKRERQEQKEFLQRWAAVPGRGE